MFRCSHLEASSEEVQIGALPPRAKGRVHDDSVCSQAPLLEKVTNIALYQVYLRYAMRHLLLRLVTGRSQKDGVLTDPTHAFYSKHPRHVNCTLAMYVGKYNILTCAETVSATQQAVCKCPQQDMGTSNFRRPCL
jgi:hypothetical protein